MADTLKLNRLRPGAPVADWYAATGNTPKPPDPHDEGHLFGPELSARAGADGRLGLVRFGMKFPQQEPIAGVSLGMTAEALRQVHPQGKAVAALPELQKYGWSLVETVLEDGVALSVGLRDGVVGTIHLEDPQARYPERPFQDADRSLTEAFDLSIAPPVSLDRRPAQGWCLGLPPGIEPAHWPLSPRSGLPMRHAFTLRLPEAYRTQGPDLVAITLFVDDPLEQDRPLDGLSAWVAGLADGASSASDPRFGLLASHYVPLPAHHHRLQGAVGEEYRLVWLTQAQFDAPLATPPAVPPIPALAGREPAWLKGTCGDVFGPYHLPFSDSAAVQAWKALPAREALDFGWPIRMTLREGDPNVGRPPREWEHQNRRSGYVPAYSDEGQAMDLPRFAGTVAHLGGTMFPMQGYLDASAHYLEFEEAFGAFNFGGGNAQLCLRQMLFDWAC